MFAMLCVAVMAFSLIACAKEKVLTLSNVGNSAASETEATTETATAMEAFLQDMINFRIEEGTVVKVTGKAYTTLSTSLMAKKSDGGSIGVMRTV